ncbi:MAG TPA: FtsX-like permease family protein [Solirubrobacteraceae bacterium]|nr:FtsX-like permease family protein [Solirubrobacteraceae bacterium]
MTRGRRLLAAAIVLAAALVAGTALTAAVSLSGGFERAAARADLPDLIVRFDGRSRADVERRLGALPNVAATRYRTEFNRVWMRAGDGHAHNGALHVVEPGRRGYAIASGRDLRGRGEALVEAGVAREWDVGVGDRLRVAEGRLRVVGISLSPDNVAYPLAKAPRVYVSRSDLPWLGDRVNLAMAWLRDPARADVTLAQARAVSFGLDDLRFVTRDGVRVLIGQAAGIVIALLVAFSVVAVATAGVMLGATARWEVARRLPSIGVQRAVGFSRAAVVREQAVRGALLAAPPALLGLTIGWAAMRGPADRLLAALNELGPGTALLWWLCAAWLAIVALVAAASAWPAWTATREPVAALLRGGELAVSRRPRRWLRGGLRPRSAAPPDHEGVRPLESPPLKGSDPSPAPPLKGSDPSRPKGSDLSRPLGGLAVLGARLAAARRARWAATVAVLGAASATLVLLLALASLLVSLRDDPGTVGKRYALTANLSPSAVPDVERIPGVAAAAERTAVEASAAFSLAQPLRLVGLERGAEDFEAPPLAEGRRRRAADEAEVGSGLADALGLRPGSQLAVALPGGREERFRVAGIVRALENDGRIAYVREERLDALGAFGNTVVAIRLDRGADRAAVRRGLEALGARPSDAAAATTRDRAFLAVLAAVLRIVAGTVALVCLVVLAQALVLTARERRPTLALLRTVGAGRAALARVLAGACAAVLVPAALIGVAVEALVLGPAVSSLAAGYAGLSLDPSPGHLALAAAALAALGAAAVAVVGRRVEREAVVVGLREEG